MTNPVYYHLHHQNEMGDLPFWNKLANEMGDPILELGCGTGRLLLPLIQAGHEVVGIDKSYPALDYLICFEKYSLLLVLVEINYEKIEVLIPQ